MERIKYQELVNLFEGNIPKKWDREKIKKLEKESRIFEIKNGILYKKGKTKSLRVLKEDEIDSVIFITHNHPTGGHFGKDATYNKICTRFW